MKKSRSWNWKNRKLTDKNKNLKVEISGFDAAKKLNIIKEIKALLGLGLKESKDLVEKLPALVKQSIPSEEAEALRDKLVAIGCEIKLT